MLQRISHSQAYTVAIGQDLGIEAHEEAFHPDKGKPVFKVASGPGGQPNLLWTKGKFEGVEIWKDSGQGYMRLDRDMRPDYIDKSDLPPAGTTALWKYKMIYLFKDEVVGHWSDEVSFTVQGEV